MLNHCERFPRHWGWHGEELRGGRWEEHDAEILIISNDFKAVAVCQSSFFHIY